MNQEYINFFIIRILKLNLPNLYSFKHLSFKELEGFLFPKKQYKIIGIYGSGVEGLVFKIQHRVNRKAYALKVIPYSDSDKNTLLEFNFQKKFAKYDLSPRIVKINIFNGNFWGQPVRFGLAIMNPIHSTVRKYLEESRYLSKDSQLIRYNKIIQALKCLIYKKYILGYPHSYLHGDMHIDNLIILEDTQTLGFIDFGYGIQLPSLLQVLDCIPLVSSIKFTKKITNSVKEYLGNEIIRIYNELFSIHLEYDYFKYHPGNGYGYKDPKMPLYIHSYNWTPYSVRNPLPTVKELKQYFSTIQTPKVI